MTKRVAILGGGVSGISAAFWLTEILPDVEITLFDEQGKLGGMVSSQLSNELLLEYGPLAFPFANSQTGNMLKRAGLEKDLVPSGTGKGLGLWDGKTMFPFPLTAWSTFFHRTLSLRGWLRLMIEPFIPRSTSEIDESVQAFFHRRTGEEFLYRLMEPFTASILAGDANVLSLQANIPRLRTMERVRGSLTRGFGKQKWEEWCTRNKCIKPKYSFKSEPKNVTTQQGSRGIIEGLEKHLRSRGVRISTYSRIDAVYHTNRFHLEWKEKEKPKQGKFEAVISCLPSYALADMRGFFPVWMRDFFRDIPHSPLGMLHLTLPTSGKKLKGFSGDGFLTQRKSNAAFLSCFFPSRLAQNQCPQGQESIRVLVGGARQKLDVSDFKISKMRDEARFVKQVTKEVGSILGQAEGPTLEKLALHSKGIPQLIVGHLQKLAKTQKELETDAPGFILAGTSFFGSGLEKAVSSGKKAAEQVEHFFRVHKEFESISKQKSHRKTD